MKKEKKILSNQERNAKKLRSAKAAVLSISIILFIACFINLFFAPMFVTTLSLTSGNVNVVSTWYNTITFKYPSNYGPIADAATNFEQFYNLYIVGYIGETFGQLAATTYVRGLAAVSLAVSGTFLILIIILMIDSSKTKVNKNYVYATIAFSVIVGLIETLKVLINVKSVGGSLPFTVHLLPNFIKAIAFIVLGIVLYIVYASTLLKYENKVLRKGMYERLTQKYGSLEDLLDDYEANKGKKKQKQEKVTAPDLDEIPSIESPEFVEVKNEDDVKIEED